MNTERVTSAMNSVTRAYVHYSHLFLASDIGQLVTSMPLAVIITASIWLALMIFSPKFRNPDTNPIILNLVKLIAIIFVVAWMTRVEINYRKQVHNAL